MKKKYTILILILAIILIISLNFLIQKAIISNFSQQESTVKEEKTNPTTIENPSKEITSFHYQLQNAEYSELKNLDVDVIIIDIDDANLEKSEILSLKKDKIVLSYLSIGEAEDYRNYWKDGWKPGNPSFIGKENPDWEGNYKVMYWNKEWQDIIISKVEEIALKGYSGVYLDIIDAYEYYTFMSSIHSAEEMVKFVKKIRDKGRKFNQNFLIVPQNAPELYELYGYKELIDGFGKEDTWYDSSKAQDEEETEFTLKYLDKAVKDNKFVLAIDYPEEQNKICSFYKNCWKHGFACTVSNRDLDRNKPIVCNN